MRLALLTVLDDSYLRIFSNWLTEIGGVTSCKFSSLRELDDMLEWIKCTKAPLSRPSPFGIVHEDYKHLRKLDFKKMCKFYCSWKLWQILLIGIIVPIFLGVVCGIVRSVIFY